MNFDWKSVVRSIAPTLGTALGGPMAGAAVKVLGEALLGDPNSSEAKVAQAVAAGLSPDAIVALRQADQAFEIRMRELDIDLAKLNADVERAYLADVSDARKANAGDAGVFRLGISVLVTFAAVMAAVLYGSFQLLTGGIQTKDIAVVATVSSLIGTVVGYVAANAQQVVAYFFGSSKGSADKTAAMAQAVAGIGKR